PARPGTPRPLVRCSARWAGRSTTPSGPTTPPGPSSAPPVRCRTCRPSRGPSSSTPPSGALRGRRRSASATSTGSTPAPGSRQPASRTTGTTRPRTSPRGSRAASYPRGSRERDEVRDLPGCHRGRPHRLAPAMARRAGRRLHELRVEGRNRVNLADTIVQSLHGSQSVRYATVVGSTGTGAQVSIGGDTIEVAYVGDTPPEVGKRAVLVSSNGSLLCIGTTTTQEPEWSEPQQMLVRPQGDWLATTGYPWEEEQWGSSGFGAGVANPTSGIWAGTVHKTDFTSGTYLGEYLGEGEVEFAVQYPDLGGVLPPEAELLGVSLRLYSTYRYTTVQRLGEYLFYKTPNVARPVDVTIE